MNKEKLLKFFQPTWWVLIIVFAGAFLLSFLSVFDFFLDIFFFVFYIALLYGFISSIVLLFKRKHIILNTILLVILALFLILPLIFRSTSTIGIVF